jgi:hypothetical protein
MAVLQLSPTRRCITRANETCKFRASLLEVVVAVWELAENYYC